MNNKDRMVIFEKHKIEIRIRRKGNWCGIKLWYYNSGCHYFINQWSVRGGRYKALRTMFEDYKDLMWKKCNE